MPNINDMIVSKWISGRDLPTPLILTIRTLTNEKFGSDEFHWVLWFHEHKKGLKLNNTNMRILAAGFGDQTEGWIGQRLKLWHDPTVQMAGKIVGGVRITLPSVKPATAAQSDFMAGGAAPAGARFDPMTGRPIPQPAAAPAPRFDPMTGKPLAPPAPARTPETAAMQEFVDAATGEIHPQSTAVEGEFDDDIPF